MKVDLSHLLAAYDGVANPPADAMTVESVRVRARRFLGIVLPDDYCEFLRQANGGCRDGLLLYPTDPVVHDTVNFPGVIDINLLRRSYRTGLRAMFLVGEMDDDFLVYHPAFRCYLRVDRHGLDPYEEASSLLALTVPALQRRS